MREIKFRFFCKGKMYYPRLIGLMYKYDDNPAIYEEVSGIEPVPHYKDGNLMQYTGLTDKNGNEIYEGDVVKISIEQYGYDGSTKDYRVIVGEVKWSHLGFDIRIGTHDRKPVYSDIVQEMHLVDNIISDEWEIIGNIYENPELLTEVTE